MVSPVIAPAPPSQATPQTSSAPLGTVPAPNAPDRTLWGLDPFQLYTRFWAAHGVQVVRQGEPSPIIKHAELFLLTEPRTLVLFKLQSVVMDALNWVKPQVLFVRLHDARERTYREEVVADEFDRFVRFTRQYDTKDQLVRVVLTPEREVAQLWQSAPDPLTGWRRLRRFTPRIDRLTIKLDGSAFPEDSDREVAYFLQEMLQLWQHPGTTIQRAHRGPGAVWKDPTSSVGPGAKFIGPVWIGAGRHVIGDKSPVIGPAILWDNPQQKPVSEAIQWLDIQPTAPPDEPAPKSTTALEDGFKWAFDRTFALLAIICSLPLYPFIMIAIWLEDGRPFFFAHRRETLGGREFPCLKFRSMRKDAEKIKAQLKALNRADGPQFYIENDPRLTRVGKILRKYNLDEVPQFLNVLVGDMSLVGPRPSPYSENQFCPPWREARLSVRPGVTGLWQVRRTRRAGSDFQEWIKYDIEYVENRTWWLDMVIIWKTIMTILRKGTRQ